MHLTIHVRCAGCNARIKAPVQLLGRVRCCPGCKRRLIIQSKAPDDARPVLVYNENQTRSAPFGVL